MEQEIKDFTRELKALYKQYIKDIELYLTSPQNTFLKSYRLEYLKNKFNQEDDKYTFQKFYCDVFNHYYHIPFSNERNEYSPRIDPYAKSDKARIKSIIENLNEMNITINQYLRKVEEYTQYQINYYEGFLNMPEEN